MDYLRAYTKLLADTGMIIKYIYSRLEFVFQVVKKDDNQFNKIQLRSGPPDFRISWYELLSLENYNKIIKNFKDLVLLPFP